MICENKLHERKLPKKNIIKARIDFINKLLKNKDVESLIDYESMENSMNKEYSILPSGNEIIESNMNEEYCILPGENETILDNQYDARVILKKKYMDFVPTITSLVKSVPQIEYIKSGYNYHIFKTSFCDANNKKLDYSIKILMYSKNENYGTIYDIRRPENAELKMFSVLSKLVIKKQTPHIILPITSFDTDINNFIFDNCTNNIGENNEKYQDFMIKYKNGNYENTCGVLITEFATRGDLMNFLRHNYNKPNFTPMHWKCIFFQILSVLAVIHENYPSFRHNDLRVNNIFIDKIDSTYCDLKYKIAKKKYNVKNIGYQIKLSNFNFSCISGNVDNRITELEWTRNLNITSDKNRYYDIHYFFNTLIKKGYVGNIMSCDSVPEEVKNFINRILPDKYNNNNKISEFVHEKGRLLINDEYLTPLQILESDPYFDEFRIVEDYDITNI